MGERTTKEEYFKLRWEYLKRSGEYKKYCEWKRFGGKKPDCEWANAANQGQKELTMLDYCEFNYSFFGDIHENSFETWWENRPRHIFEYGAIVENDIDKCIENFKKCEGREPSLEEFKTKFVGKIKDHYHVYLRINLVAADVKELGAVFENILKERKTDGFVKSAECFICLPENGRMAKELEHYLKIYDQKEMDLSTEKIIKKVGTEAEKNDPKNLYNQDQYRAKLAKARKIIYNVERCQFPGKYQ
jgi:hypothetical protein